MLGVAMAGVNQPDINGGSGNPRIPNQGGSGGGGTPGSPTGTSGGTAVPGENGGVIGSTYFLFVPIQDTTGNCWFGFFDISSFDDPKDGSEYDWRVEDIDTDNVPTVNWVVIDYRDIGAAKINVTIQGVNDNKQVVSKTVTVQIGNVSPTNAILTVRVGISLSAWRPQLKVTRAASSGPVDITRAIMEGEA